MSIFKEAKAQDRKILTEIEAKDILRAGGIPVVETVLAKSKEESQMLASNLGFPVVLKVCSPHIVHKTDMGGVFLDLNNVEEVGNAYEKILKTVIAQYPGADIKEVAVQKMVSEGVEVVVGMSRDPQFGPLIMFGLGGIFVEIMKDVSFRVVPLSEADAWEMISEIKGKALLEGVRGTSPVNKEALIDIIIKLSNLVEENPEMKELDINPLFVNSKDAIVADARIILE